MPSRHKRSVHSVIHGLLAYQSVLKKPVIAVISTFLLFASQSSGATKQALPRPRPSPPAAAPAELSSDSVTDLSHAMPAKTLSKLPTTEDQFRSLNSEIIKSKPVVATAKSKSDALAKQAETLQQKLVATAQRIEYLEQDKVKLDADIIRLTAENRTLSEAFRRDRVSASRLLAILERLQHDMPPALALRPDDALSAARGAMLIGASLPTVYGEAASLARRIETLRRTRLALIASRAQADTNTVYLAQAHIELDQLLAIKRLEADAAATRYDDLKQRLDAIALQAANLEALLQKVAALRTTPGSPNIVTVTAQGTAVGGKLARDSLLRPVVGAISPGGLEGVGGGAAPGLTYTTAPGAQVVSPADGTILFAGPYHKSGQVLILEMAGGYDAVLAGLDRVDVRPENQVLAGEPVGMMSRTEQSPRLYFELRQDGRGINPAPFIGVALRKAKKP